ncbi:MAG: 50S ribosomal protein L9 [Alphaproteobacteria bacterium]|nr:50S ribosomal protein L9 [Alphaproteobacteria bacterium]
MDIILLERIEKLGQMGDVVKVKAGFARNYLLPHKKALRATKENLAYFSTQRQQLEAENIKHRDEAQKIADKLNGLKVVVIRSAGDTGQLYGSVNARDIANAVTEAGFTVQRSQVVMERPVKALGLFDLRVRLHPEVSATITANIARSEDEAAEQQRLGHAIIAGELEEADEERARAEAEAMFEPEAIERVNAEAEEAAEEAAAAESDEK